MRGALGARGVKVDVAHRLEVARPAVGAALDRAVGRELALDRSRQILLQEARAHAGIQVIPGEELAERTAPQVERRVESFGGERVAPEGDLTAVGPAVEAGSGALCALDDRSESPVAAGEHALQPRELAVVPAELDAAASELSTQQRLARLGLLDVELRGPLERRVRLRRERRDARGDGEPPARGALHPARQLGDPVDVVDRLARQADHEVQLEGAPPEVGEEARGVEQLLFAVLLLDDVAQALGAGFGREREAGLPDAADLLEDARRERIDPRRRQRHRHVLRRELVHQRLEHRIDAAVVARGEGEQRHLLVSGACDELARVCDHALRVALAQRAVHVARLAEAAALHAAAHHLDAGAVVHHSQVRNDRIRRRRERVQVGQDPLGHPRPLRVERRRLGEGAVGLVARVEEGRHVHAGDPRQRLQQGSAIASIPLAHRVDDLSDGLLAVAQDDGVEERRQRLGIEGARSARDHDRIVGGPLRAARAARRPGRAW